VLQRHLSKILLAGYTLASLAFLSWSADNVVRTLKHTAYYVFTVSASPPLEQMEQWGRFGSRLARLIRADRDLHLREDLWRRDRLDRARMEEVERENARLRALLQLDRRPYFRPLAARVWARDPGNGYHSVMARRGSRQGVGLGGPVVTESDGRETYVGQVVEVFNDNARILLATDPSSAVSAAVARSGEQGAVEGGGTAFPVLNYLLPDADVRVGDEVVTAGLGGTIPAGLLLGWVDDVETGERDGFKRARLRPAFRLGRLREVLILLPVEGEKIP
jgi:rod shape-determining protein MreC